MIAKLLAAALAAGVLAAPPSWRVVSNREGIEVANRANDRSGLPQFRVEADVSAPLSLVFAIVYDADHHCTWMAACSGARLVELDDPFHGLIWFQRDVPWPLADRDAVMRTRVTVLEPGRSVRLRFDQVHDRGPAPPRGVERMARLRGHWTLHREDDTRTRVIYEVDVDPGISLPGFLTRSITESQPRQTLLGLRRRARASAERYADFERAWAPRLGLAGATPPGVAPGDRASGSGEPASPRKP